MKEEGNTNAKISEITGIPIRTVQWYVKEIHVADKNTWADLSQESVEGIAIKMKKVYEKLATKAENMIDDPNISAKDLEIAAKICIGSHQNIIKLITEGPLALPTVKSKELPNKEDEVI